MNEGDGLAPPHIASGRELPIVWDLLREREVFLVGYSAVFNFSVNASVCIFESSTVRNTVLFQNDSPLYFDEEWDHPACVVFQINHFTFDSTSFAPFVGAQLQIFPC